MLGEKKLMIPVLAVLFVLASSSTSLLVEQLALLGVTGVVTSVEVVLAVRPCVRSESHGELVFVVGVVIRTGSPHRRYQDAIRDESSCCWIVRRNIWEVSVKPVVGSSADHRHQQAPWFRHPTHQY